MIFLAGYMRMLHISCLLYTSFGVNLICVEDGIDSSKDAGKLMISVLSAVAEIERENIRVQTMEGDVYKRQLEEWEELYGGE